MFKVIISILIFIFICVPLTLELVQSFKGKWIVKKREVIATVILACIFVGLVLGRVYYGSNYEPLSEWKIYLILLVVAGVIARCR